MSYQLEIAEPIDVGVRRIPNELIDDTIARIEVTGTLAIQDDARNCSSVGVLSFFQEPIVAGG